MASLLKSILRPDDNYELLIRCSFAIDDSGTVIIQSLAYPDFGSVSISVLELQALEEASVLCHNDVEPRNILVRKSAVEEDNQPIYHLAAIIDWEICAFMPFSLETALKDKFLGLQNLSYNWYRRFKEQTFSTLIPRQNTAHGKIQRAVMLEDQASRRDSGKNVGRAIQKKWIEREKLELA